MRKQETGPSVFARFHILPGRVPSFRGRVPCRVPKDREYSAAVQLRWNLVLTAKGFRRHPLPRPRASNMPAACFIQPMPAKADLLYVVVIARRSQIINSIINLCDDQVSSSRLADNDAISPHLHSLSTHLVHQK